MDDCIFCKIVKGEILCHKVYENEKFLAFLDNQPFTEGHTLVIPKIHFRWVYDLPNFGDYWEFAQKITQIIQKNLRPQFITYLTMGNEIAHAHIHLIPRYSDDVLVGVFLENLRSHPSLKDFQNIIDKIHQNSKN